MKTKRTKKDLTASAKSMMQYGWFDNRAKYVVSICCAECARTNYRNNNVKIEYHYSKAFQTPAQIKAKLLNEIIEHLQECHS